MLTDAVSLEKFVRFAIHLIASPKYIRNPYLRSKLAGFLAEFVPKEGERASLGFTFLPLPLPLSLSQVHLESSNEFELSESLI
jgi:hypothetical protein